jgi:hypothetical protein
MRFHVKQHNNIGVHIMALDYVRQAYIRKFKGVEGLQMPTEPVFETYKGVKYAILYNCNQILAVFKQTPKTFRLVEDYPAHFNELLGF